MAGKVTIDDAPWKALQKRLAALARGHVKVGILSNPDHDGIGMAELAAIHEFGAPARKIPERPFIRATFRDKAADFAKLQARIGKGVIEGRFEAPQAFGLLGTRGEAEVKKTIASGPHIPPKLQEATIDARERRSGKRSTRPLVDTGRLLGSISHEVKL